MAKSKSEQGRFAYEGLDRVIHEKARLSVLTSLVAHPKGLVFGDLKALCGLTDGNLSRHLPQIAIFPRVRGTFDLQILPVIVMKFLQRLD